MSESRQRFINQLSSSIFAEKGPVEEPKIRSKRRLVRVFSDQSLNQEISKNTMSPLLRPNDHSFKDFFGEFPSDFYRKDVKGFHNNSLTPVKPKKEIVNKITSQSVSFNSSFMHRTTNSLSFIHKNTNFLSFVHKNTDSPIFNQKFTRKGKSSSFSISENDNTSIE